MVGREMTVDAGDGRDRARHRLLRRIGRRRDLLRRRAARCSAISCWRCCAPARRREIHTALDTCGFAPWDAIERIRGCVDLFLYDLKLMDDARHREFTGVSNRADPEQPAGASRQRGHAIVLRVPDHPGRQRRRRESMRADRGVCTRRLPQPRAGSTCCRIISIGVDKYARLGQAVPAVRDRAAFRRSGWPRSPQLLEQHLDCRVTDRRLNR